MFCTLGDTNLLFFTQFIRPCWSCMEWVNRRCTGKVVLRSNHKSYDTVSCICATNTLCSRFVWEGWLVSKPIPSWDIDGIHKPCLVGRRTCMEVGKLVDSGLLDCSDGVL
jgi:hypothetical protein